MLKNILKLEGAQNLTNEQQKSIQGGKKMCMGPDNVCIYYGIICAESECRFAPVID